MKVPRERAAAIPYASIGVQLGTSDQVLMVLGAASPDRLEWFAGEETYLATRNGRIIRTAGLPYDLGGLRPLPPAPDDSRGPRPRTRFELDFPDLAVFGAIAQCTITDLGDDAVEIFGASIPTRHIAERCEVPALRWTFDNDFWEDRMTGYVWRSRQHIHPNSPPLILEVLRPELPASG